MAEVYKGPETIIKEDLALSGATVTETKIATITRWECWFQVVDGVDAELSTASSTIQQKYPEYIIRSDKTVKLGPCLVMQYDPSTKPAGSITSTSIKR